MHRLARRFAETSTPLAARFQRGVRAGFLVAAVLAVATLLVTETVSASLDSTHEEQRELADQRAEIASFARLIPALLEADDPADADAARIAIGTAIESVTRRHVALQIDLPDLLAQRVVVAGEAVPADAAFDMMIEEIRSVVADLSDGTLTGAASVRRVHDALAAIDALDPVYAARLDREFDHGEAVSAQLRVLGRLLFAFALTAAAVRLCLLGRPLIQRLRDEQAQHEGMADEQREVQMRSIVVSRLSEGMEAVDNEDGVRGVVERTLGRLYGDHPAEMLLADSSKAHLEVLATNPALDRPGCEVSSPWSCPAVRRGTTQIFEDSEALRACPHLRNRTSGPCAAVCVPVAFVGDSMGVLHVTGEVGWTPGDFDVFSLESLAGQSAVRLGTIRAMGLAELQASTDALTGLPNRRATEEHIARFLNESGRGAVAIADLDHFKKLNDTLGHEAGDRALRMFADVARSSVRESDLVGRWGGEEFVVLLPDLSAREAAVVLDRLRDDLAATCGRRDAPDVTVSIGVVDTTSASTVHELVALADESLYEAKERGRDRVVVGPVAAPADAGAPTSEVMT